MWAACGPTGGDHVDIVFTPCLFGASFQKPTRVRCWNWVPKALNQRCVLQDGQFSCGRSQAEPHEVLEFGGSSTAAAASYVPGVCAVWARDLWGSTRLPPRSWSRPRWLTEDAKSQAGMRNPAGLSDTWPALRRTMKEVAVLFRDVRLENKNL